MNETLIPELNEPEALKALTEVITALLNRWGLHEVNQAALLNVTDMSRFKLGEPLPKDQAVLERTGYLLAIDRALKTLHPYTPRSRDRWISTPQAKFDGRSPLQVMLAEGIEGIKEIRRNVEFEAKLKRNV